jgi:hypothetical protein
MLEYAVAWSRWVRGHTRQDALERSLDTPEREPLRDKSLAAENHAKHIPALGGILGHLILGLAAAQQSGDERYNTFG